MESDRRKGGTAKHRKDLHLKHYETLKRRDYNDIRRGKDIDEQGSTKCAEPAKDKRQSNTPNMRACWNLEGEGCSKMLRVY